MSAHPSSEPRARTHEQIFRTLFQRIIQGELAVGSRLPTERGLAQTFAVNRATVREALRHLENLELVAVRQGDGAYVRDYLESGNLEVAKLLMRVNAHTRREVMAALLEIRRVHLPEVAYAAALRRTPAHLRQLERACRHDPAQPLIERDRQVHQIIARASGNILHVLLTNYFKDCFYDFGAAYFNEARHCRRSERFHREICAAVADQNAGHAREIMRAVLEYAETVVLAGMPSGRATAER
jgi:DNA-binding FadR family transcriptional regulator